jgi:tetratricopeptide (TPR) repeat protein
MNADNTPDNNEADFFNEEIVKALLEEGNALFAEKKYEEAKAILHKIGELAERFERGGGGDAYTDPVMSKLLCEASSRAIDAMSAAMKAEEVAKAAAKTAMFDKLLSDACPLSAEVKKDLIGLRKLFQCHELSSSMHYSSDDEDKDSLTELAERLENILNDETLSNEGKRILAQNAVLMEKAHFRQLKSLHWLLCAIAEEIRDLQSEIRDLKDAISEKDDDD